MNKQMTVDQLLEKLSSISQSGHGDMLICLGENYPLLEDDSEMSTGNHQS